jgi:PAS domain S-box-containing protein
VAALVAAPVGVFQTDADGACLFVNERWCEYAGMTREEAIGTGWLQAIHPDDRVRVTEEWAASVAQRRDFELEYRFARPDGETIWLAGSATAISDPGGEIGGYIGTVTNISGAVATRLALSEERQFVDTVLDIAGSLVCVSDPEGRFLRFNRACELVSGYALKRSVADRSMSSSSRPTRSGRSVRISPGCAPANRRPRTSTTGSPVTADCASSPGWTCASSMPAAR